LVLHAASPVIGCAPSKCIQTGRKRLGKLAGNKLKMAKASLVINTIDPRIFDGMSKML
jgi:hypothetical protein